jgi:hypothetical protein
MSTAGGFAVTPDQIKAFWLSAEEEAAVRKATHAAYERLIKTSWHKSKREAVMRFFGLRKEAQRREMDQLTAVE